MKGLTRRQEEILHFIRRFMRTEGMPPTRSEIMEQFGFASPNAAQCHLQALQAKGYLTLRPGSSRGIVPLESADGRSGQKPGLPLVGKVAAGQPVLAAENVEDTLPVDPDAFSPRPDYLLRVQGDSMIEAGILDGDLLAVHATPEVRNGQIVVARIGDEVTVKRLRIRQGTYLLEPANSAYQPIKMKASDENAIEGIGVGVIRRDLLH